MKFQKKHTTYYIYTYILPYHCFSTFLFQPYFCGLRVALHRIFFNYSAIVLKNKLTHRRSSFKFINFLNISKSFPGFNTLHGHLPFFVCVSGLLYSKRSGASNSLHFSKDNRLSIQYVHRLIKNKNHIIITLPSICRHVSSHDRQTIVAL